MKKEGTLFDLPIGIGILSSNRRSHYISYIYRRNLFLGELSLDGTIRRIKGALAIAYDAKKLGKKRIILPKANAHEASLINDLEIIGVDHITESYCLSYAKKLPLHQRSAPLKLFNNKPADPSDIDFAQVKGQQLAKRALQIAAAGRHNILFIGPSGRRQNNACKTIALLLCPP